VAFHDLRLAVVDEQHRFGVRQRMDLMAARAAPPTSW
jgi:ATP-dependent DNA helicase RecG